MAAENISSFDSVETTDSRSGEIVPWWLMFATVSTLGSQQVLSFSLMMGNRVVYDTIVLPSSPRNLKSIHSHYQGNRKL